MLLHKIVLLPFPFDDLSTSKVRPAICLTDRIGEHEHVVVAFITSKIPADLLETDLVIGSDHAEFSSCGLKVSSAVRLHRLMTISVNLIQRELGRLPSLLQAEAKTKIARLFSLTSLPSGMGSR